MSEISQIEKDKVLMALALALGIGTIRKRGNKEYFALEQRTAFRSIFPEWASKKQLLWDSAIALARAVKTLRGEKGRGYNSEDARRIFEKLKKLAGIEEEEGLLTEKQRREIIRRTMLLLPYLAGLKGK